VPLGYIIPMRNALIGIIGLGLSACATSGARGPGLGPFAQTAPVQNAAVADGANTDELICERNFEADSTCPVLGTLNDTEQQSLASFTQGNRVQPSEMQQPHGESPAPAMMQATDDQEF
jgi:hypothetical protein